MNECLPFSPLQVVTHRASHSVLLSDGKKAARVGKILNLGDFLVVFSADSQTNEDQNQLYNNQKIVKLKDLANA